MRVAEALRPAWTPAEAADVSIDIARRLADAGLPLPLRLWDGSEFGPPAPYRVVLNHPWSLRSLFLPPSDLAAGEAYVHGDVDVEGDMVAALTAVSEGAKLAGSLGTRVAVGAQLLRLPTAPRRRPKRRARLRGAKHSRARDRAAVLFHYDLGNAFFAQFLDQRMVYSCAYFTDDDDDLDRAQERKLDLICRKLRLEPGRRLLDIGCGWGALVTHAAAAYGVTAVGITLSRQQAALATERVAAAGLSDRVEIRVQDYREVTDRFDAVASVGMVEHVGADKLADYFRHTFSLTSPGGRFLNHGITTGRRQVVRDFSRDRNSFVGRYVFPDGALVPAWRAARHMEQAGFELIDVEQLRPHYGRTLRHWVSRLEANREAAVAASSEMDYRIWRAYMAGAAVGFDHGDLGVVQVLGSRGARLPLGRFWMSPTPATQRESATAAQT